MFVSKETDELKTKGTPLPFASSSRVFFFMKTLYIRTWTVVIDVYIKASFAILHWGVIKENPEVLFCPSFVQRVKSSVKVIKEWKCCFIQPALQLLWITRLPEHHLVNKHQLPVYKLDQPTYLQYMYAVRWKRVPYTLQENKSYCKLICCSSHIWLEDSLD